MELQPDRTLQQILDAKQVLTSDQAIRAALDLALALDGFHKQGKILGGVFPDQVIINLQSGSRFLELGAVRDPDELTLSYLHFVPPECLEKKPATERSDLYSLGVILYSLLSSRMPFTGTNREELIQMILSGSGQVISGVRPELEFIIRRCLLHSAERRFASAQDVAIELKKCAQPRSVAESVAIRQPRTARFIQKRGKALAVIIAVIPVLIAVVYMILTRDPSPVDPMNWKEVRVTSEKYEERDPTLSSDGTSVAFTSDRTGNVDLYVMPVSAKKAVQITRSPGKEENPRWSPAQDQILFTYRAPDGATVYSISSSGGVPQQLISDAIDGQWSADGNQICYVAPAAGPIRSLYVFDLEKELTKTVLEAIKNISHPTFSKNSKEIVVSIDGHLELVEVKSGKRTKLTEGPNDFFPTWNWQTDSIYFSSRSGKLSQLWRSNRDGETVQITKTDRDDFRPVPSLKTNRIAFHRNNQLTDILVIQPETGTVRNISFSQGKAHFSSEAESSIPIDERISELLSNSIAFASRPKTKKIALLTSSGIDLVDTESGDRTNIFNFTTEERGSRIAWSSDGKTLYCERVRPGADVYYLE